MKYAVLFALLFASPAFAFNYFEDFESSYCRGMRQTSGSQVICWGAADAKEVLKAPVSKKNQVTYKKAAKHFRNFLVHSVVDLGIWPDDSTDGIYNYYYLLRNAKKEVIGYFVISGFANSEMESKIQISARYNGNGELVSVKVD